MIPGLHINTVAEMLYFYGFGGFYGLVFLYVLVGIAAALDAIYAVALNIPDGATGIMPAAAQRMAAVGRLGKGVYSYLLGGIYALAASAVLIPFLFVSLPILQPFVQENMFLILVFASSYVLLSGFRGQDLAVFAMAGLFGLLVLGEGSSELIFPMFVGFFTIPMLMVRSKQAQIEDDYKTKIEWKIPIICSAATALMYLIPGVATPTQIIILAGIFSKISEDDFVTALGAVSASNILYSIMMTDIIGKARTGVAIVSEKMIEGTVMQHAVAAGAGALAFILIALVIMRFLPRAVGLFSPFNNKWMKLLLASYLGLLVLVITGPQGLLVMGAASVVGGATLVLKARRTNLMASIIAGALKYYFK